MHAIGSRAVTSKKRFQQLLQTSQNTEILNHVSDVSYLLPCDEIIYLNHSCNANILDSGMGFDVTVEDIKRGDETTYDYRFFHDPDELEFKCLCGEVNCCKVVRCIHPAPELSKYWRKRIDSALFSIH